MLEKHDNLLDPETPLIFADGTSVYNELGKKYITHKVGYFILAPSGAGKTHFVKSQDEMNWLDGDDLWMAANAQPDGKWWLGGIDNITEVDQRSDVITIQAKKLGFWIVGASNSFLKPDAIVIPNWQTHQGWIASREKSNYDGGATTGELDQVVSHREWIAKWEEQGVPKFETVDEAASFLASQ
jgi:hypothetical protein